MKVDRAALLNSIQQGDVAVVLNALSRIGVDAPLTSLGQTALQIACAAGTLPLVMALLKAGADANATDRTGASCVALASTAGHAHVLEKSLFCSLGCKDFWFWASVVCKAGLCSCMRGVAVKDEPLGCWRLRG